MATRVAKVAADCLANVPCRAHKPKHDEERHHGGNKIGIGNLPGASPVTELILRPAIFMGWIHVRSRTFADGLGVRHGFLLSFAEWDFLAAKLRFHAFEGGPKIEWYGSPSRLGGHQGACSVKESCNAYAKNLKEFRPRAVETL